MVQKMEGWVESRPRTAVKKLVLDYEGEFGEYKVPISLIVVETKMKSALGNHDGCDVYIGWEPGSIYDFAYGVPYQQDGYTDTFEDVLQMAEANWNNGFFDSQLQAMLGDIPESDFE